MINKSNVTVSQHARKRLFERFINPELLHATDEAKRNEFADEVIMEMFAESVYVSVEAGAKLFSAKAYRSNLIVKNNTIVTILKFGEGRCRKKKVRRSRKFVLGLIRERKG